jgi:hypothetical protein
MTRNDVVNHLLMRAAYEDTLGPTGEGAILREAAAMLLLDENNHYKKVLEELTERLTNGIQSR